MEIETKKGKTKKVEIIVKNSEYVQNSLEFQILFDDPLHPYVPWPKSSYRQTVEQGVDLRTEPQGPK
jgi:hypothetical protein